MAVSRRYDALCRALLAVAAGPFRFSVRVQPLRSDPVRVGDSLADLLERVVVSLPEFSVLAVTSKVVSLCEGRVISRSDVASKYELVKSEADAYLPEGDSPWGVHLTIKNGVIIASAGIDESNVEGEFYVLYPKDCQESARAIWRSLRQRFDREFLGVVVTDSHVTPLRRGVTGVGLAWCGFLPTHDYVGKPDVFGRLLRVTKSNVLDALASAAVLCMGEGSEQTPFALLTDLPNTVRFVSHEPTKQEERAMFLSAGEDIYASLLHRAGWIWNG